MSHHHISIIMRVTVPLRGVVEEKATDEQQQQQQQRTSKHVVPEACDVFDIIAHVSMDWLAVEGRGHQLLNERSGGESCHVPLFVLFSRLLSDHVDVQRVRNCAHLECHIGDVTGSGNKTFTSTYNN